LDELLRAILPQREKKDGGHDHPHVVAWTKLHKAIKDILPERNLLAHAPVKEIEAVQTRMPLTHPDPFVTLATWLEIIVSEGEKLRGRSESKPIRATDLTTHLRAIEMLTARISVFHGTIAAEPPVGPPLHKSQRR
jgi:hypothetical protein